MDVKTAFLNEEQVEEIYMSQPMSFEKGQKRKVCMLKHSIYGLKQYSRQWYFRFHDSIISHGFEMIEEDHCVYLKSLKKSLLILSFYVDNILIAGNDMDCIVYKTRVWTITRSTGRRDSLLNGRKMWVDFRVLENPSPRRNGFALESPLTFIFIFKWGKSSKNKKPQ